TGRRTAIPRLGGIELMRLLSLLPILAVSALLAGCGGSDSNAKAEPTAAAIPIPVRVQAVTAKPWADTYEATGTVRARATAVLSSKVMAYVRQVNPQVG